MLRRLSLVSLCLPLRSDARCCDAGCHAVTLAPGRVSRLSLVSRWLRGRVSRLFFRCCALVLKVVIGTHGHGHVSTHARWLYNLTRVANAAVCKLMQVLSCFACGKTFRRAREENSNQKWHVPSLGRKLLRLMRMFQQSSETATKCCGDGKVH